MQSSTIYDSLAWASGEIASQTAKLDAEVILSYVLDKSRSFLFAWPDHILTDEQQCEFGFLIHERARGKPVAYLVGEQEFWSLPLKVSNNVLVPRPETEDMLRAIFDTFAGNDELDVIDVGTGSGAIALVMASERSAWNVMAVDISPDALAIASENASKLGFDINFLHSDLLASVSDKKFDLIVSNPPYIAENDPHLSALRYEPKLALVAGADGLCVIRPLLDQAFSCLKNGGYLFVEHGYEQGLAVRDLFILAGFDQVVIGKDLAGQDRFTFGIKSLESANE